MLWPPAASGALSGAMGVQDLLKEMAKDRNSMDLTEAEDIKKRWQQNTEELYKKGFNDLDNHDDVITHLEPDSLDCQV